jgi:hypothetical protein
LISRFRANGNRLKLGLLLMHFEIPQAAWFTGGILLVALFLGLRQWFDQRSRVPDLFPDDVEFFKRQDRRRYFGVAVMVALAILLGAIASDGLLAPESILQVILLLVVFALIVVLLILAFLDGLATRRYARRHGRELANEHAKLMIDLIRRSSQSVNSGRSKPDDKAEAPEV